MALSFAGKTAIITGAGGAIGRSYALEFARRGCNIVVNDLGSSVTGASSQTDAAGDVVKEINNNGGKAVVSRENVLNSQAILDVALKNYGRVDILINNAGILRDKSMAKMTKDDWDAIMSVHLDGTFGLCHAAWPIMQAQKYGRIINVGSGAGLYGNFGQANYSAAKMGILGLTNTLAIEGEKYGINANCIVPVASSRMTETVLSPEMLKLLDPSHIVPIVTYLAHETCAHSGGCFEVGGGWYSQVRIQRSEGVSLASSGQPAVSAETLASNFSKITDFSTNARYPTTPADAIRDMVMMAEKRSAASTTPTNVATSSTQSAASTGAGTAALPPFPSDKLFNKIQHVLDSDPSRARELTEKMNAKIGFYLTSNDDPKLVKKWILNLKTDAAPSVSVLDASAPPFTPESRPNVTLFCSDKTFLSIATGSTSAEFAYMRGQLQIKGQVAVALKLKTLLPEMNK